MAGSCILTSKETTANAKLKWAGIVIPADRGKDVALQTKHSAKVPPPMFTFLLLNPQGFKS